jgi:hypothetical protein
MRRERARGHVHQNGVSSQAILYMLGIISNRPWDAVNVIDSERRPGGLRQAYLRQTRLNDDQVPSIEARSAMSCCVIGTSSRDGSMVKLSK